MFLGNGTLNKHAGVDYKQLSLLAKINENQSGEVLYAYYIFTLLDVHSEPMTVCFKEHVIDYTLSMFISCL